MKHIIIEIEADKKSLNIDKYKDLADRLENALVWFGMQHIKINIKQKKNEPIKEDSKPVSEHKAW